MGLSLGAGAGQSCLHNPAPGSICPVAFLIQGEPGEAGDPGAAGEPGPPVSIAAGNRVSFRGKTRRAGARSCSSWPQKAQAELLVNILLPKLPFPALM